MSRMIEVNWTPDDRVLRQFGFITLAVFSVLSWAAWHQRLVFSHLFTNHSHEAAAVLAAAGVLSALASLVAPRANRPLFLGLTLLSYPIGFVLSYVMIGVIFFIVMAVPALAMRMFGRAPLKQRFDPSATSYWEEPRPRLKRDGYFRQF